MRKSETAALAALLALAAGCQSDMARQSAAAGPGSPNWSCYRHIYNTSQQPWTFSASTGSGNLYFNNVPGSCTTPNGPCTIAPGTTAEIQYTTTGGFSSGTITITDIRRVQKSFGYASSMMQCPYIRHEGSTGSVVLNDPANGDMAPWGDTW